MKLYSEAIFFRFMIGMLIGSIIGTLLPFILTIFYNDLCSNSHQFNHNLISILRNTKFNSKNENTGSSKNGFDFKSLNYQLLRTKKLRKKKSGFVYVGMMSTDTLVRNRGLSAAQTWAQDLSRRNKKTGERSPTARLEIYADTKFLAEQYPDLGVNTITMKNINDSVYPPQKKSFSMIKYMHDHYINDYEWFIRFDDDAYLNWENLEKFLRTVDSNQPVMLGSAGYGKDAEDFIEEGMNYCMGGPGVVFSREALKRVRPHLGTCLKNLMTSHEDVELGRCVYKMAGIPCTNSWEATKLFWQNFRKPGDLTHLDVGYFQNIVEAPQDVLRKAVILHANKESKYQFKLFVDILKDRIKQQQEKQMIYKNKLVQLEDLFNEKLYVLNNNNDNPENTLVDLTDNEQFFKVIKNRNSRLKSKKQGYKSLPKTWIQIQRGHIYKFRREDECNRKVEDPWTSVVSDNIREAAKQIYQRKNLLGKITKIEVPLIYHTSDHVGAHYIADVAMRQLRYNGYHSTAELSTIKARVYMTQYFSKNSIIESTFVGSNPEYVNSLAESNTTREIQHPEIEPNLYKELTINTSDIKKLIHSRHKLPKNFKYSQYYDTIPMHFIVPFSGRPDNLIRFLKYYQENLLNKGVTMSLIVVLFIENQQDEGLPFVTELLEKIQDQNPESEFVLIKVEQEFNRGKGLQIGANSREADDLIVFVDVDLVYDVEFVRRIQRNTIKVVQGISKV